METQTVPKAETHEQRLIDIIRRLPPERVTEVVDFAQFIESRTDTAHVTEESAGDEEISAEDARWDALLANDQSQRSLDRMADEALVEIQAGRASLMVFAEDGEIAPG